MVDLEPLIEAIRLQDRSDRRVLDFGNIDHILDDRVHEPVPMGEERRKDPYADVAVLVDRRGEDGAAAISVPSRIIRPATEKGDSERCPADDHAKAAVIGACRTRSVNGMRTYTAGLDALLLSNVTSAAPVAEPRRRKHTLALTIVFHEHHPDDDFV